MSGEKEAPPRHFSDLRRRAEEQVQEEAVAPEGLSPEECIRLVHELRVHQVELEMQNEELRQAQVKLAEALERYADLYEFAPVGYLSLDAWGRITEANLTATNILGVERRRLVDYYFWLFLAEGERPAFQRLLQNVQNLPERRGEFSFGAGKGEARHLLLNIRFSEDSQGEVRHRLSLTDITELKKAEAELKQSQEELRRLNLTLEQRVQERTRELDQATRELESFSFSAAHDLKRPLRTIEGFSRMLLSEHTTGLDEEGRRILGVLIDNANLMKTLVDDLLNLARLACQEMRKVPLDLTGMAKGVFERLKSEEPGRAIRLIAKESPPGWGDHALLYRVLMNLLDNAFKFTRGRKPAVIEVGGQSEGQDNLYYVKDNGVGFKEEDAQKIYVVFQRLHAGEKYEGTGVGLASVQRIIQRHGGRVWAEGKVGEGATFYFTLPKRVE